ncbi:MAG: TIGR01212 family radical SAM protein [Bacteroidales bacterium]|nr:TIGR01212 family radical SAM protein [Bacteroidales bacterium]
MTIFPWRHNRRFNSYTEYFKKQFGERVQKVTINAGFTCPNRDGTKGIGGCTYCNNDAFNPSYCDPSKPVSQQIGEGIDFHANRYRRAGKFLAYFQAYSNTYDTLENLKKRFNQALQFPEIVGLVIGTRADCIDEEKLAYFREIGQFHYIIIEYGIESCYNKTLERINRGHTFEDVLWALDLTKKYGLKTGGHFIFGLPGESRGEMMNQVYTISGLPLDTIKFHQLQIIRNTVMARQYMSNPNQFNLFSLEEYIPFIINFLERLNPRFVVERFAGEVPPRFLAGPGWGKIRNDQILNRIEQRMKELNTWQGRLYKAP